MGLNSSFTSYICIETQTSPVPSGSLASPTHELTVGKVPDADRVCKW